MTFEATVIDVREERRDREHARWQLLLDHTTLREGDTGVLEAFARRGARLEIPVIAVVRDAGLDLWHVVEKPLGVGTIVRGLVDVRAVAVRE